jgi:L-aspartate oxidase
MGLHRQTFDGLVVVGAGLAGLSAALAAAPRPVLILTGAALGQGCSSAWAQGGMAAALSADDTPRYHAADTIAAGAGLVDPAMAQLLAAEGPGAVERLADWGAPFDRDAQGRFDLSLEAAHSRPRVARVQGDQAGQAIMQAVIQRVLASSHIQVREGCSLLRLSRDAGGRICGVVVDTDLGPVEILSGTVLLATGGIGGLYRVTTTPAALKGEGLAAAALAGALIGDPEFVQFHPTAIDIGRDPAPLATEALRGEGAILVDGAGRRVMTDHHPQGDLAPRDIVARAIHAETLKGVQVYLDARLAVGDHFPKDFPAVFAACMSAGIDPRHQPIPVAPACHYHMGGIVTDAWGRTDLPGLLAAGECASTGVHGANRLASNSLIEAAVFGTRAGLLAREAVSPALRPISEVMPRALAPEGLSTLRSAMSREAGVIRSGPGLSRLIGTIGALQIGAEPCLPLIAANLVAEAALARRESRGGHFRTDYPQTGPARRTVTHFAAPVSASRVAAE